MGTLELQVQEGSYFPSLLEQRRRSERALLAVVQQVYLAGVSTCRVEDLVQALGCDAVSESQVARIRRELDAFGRLVPRPSLVRRALSLPVAGCTDPEGA